MAIPVFTLDGSGLKENPREKMDILLSIYFTSDASQSTLFLNHIKSISKTMQEHIDDIEAMRSTIEDDITSLFREHLTSPEVTVTITPETDNPNLLKITVSAFSIEGSKRFDLNEIKTLDKSTFSNLKINRMV